MQFRGQIRGELARDHTNNFVVFDATHQSVCGYRRKKSFQLTLFVLGVGGLVEFGVLDNVLGGVCDSDSVPLLLELTRFTPAAGNGEF